jgi:hypothetical protein
MEGRFALSVSSGIDSSGLPAATAWHALGACLRCAAAGSALETLTECLDAELAVAAALCPEPEPAAPADCVAAAEAAERASRLATYHAGSLAEAAIRLRVLLGDMPGYPRPASPPPPPLPPLPPQEEVVPPRYAPFQPAERFDGARPGFAFRRGFLGMGYYEDAVTAPPLAAEAQQPPRPPPAEAHPMPPASGGELMDGVSVAMARLDAYLAEAGAARALHAQLLTRRCARLLSVWPAPPEPPRVSAAAVSPEGNGGGGGCAGGGGGCEEEHGSRKRPPPLLAEGEDVKALRLESSPAAVE